MERKSFLVNLLLVLVLGALVLGAVLLGLKVRVEKAKREGQGGSEKVVLKDVDYGSEIPKMGNTTAEGIALTFVEAYNTKTAEHLVQMMDLVATYIYSQCDSEGDFDRMYEETLSSNIETVDLMIMQNALQKEEKGIVDGVSNNDVELTFIENSGIEDVSKYLSKMTVKLRTVSESEGVDEVDTLEFLLLHRDGAYYIMKYDSV